MVPVPSSARLAFAAAILATATTASLLLPAAPASAAPPVEGDLGAFGYGRTDVAGCTASPGPVSEQQTFSSASGKRTAAVTRRLRAHESGTITARGRVDNTTSGIADADHGAFDTATFTARQLVRVNNINSVDCGFGVVADTQSGADLHVKHRGRLHVEWDRGHAGQIEQILVSRNGHTKLNKTRPDAHGSATIRVRPGTYLIFVQFQTRANERDIPADTTLTKKAHFRVVADYRS